MKEDRRRRAIHQRGGHGPAPRGEELLEGSREAGEQSEGGLGRPSRRGKSAHEDEWPLLECLKRERDK